MKKIGFIGYGNMARILINSLLAAGAVKPRQLVVSTRTKNKLISLKRKYPKVTIAQNNQAAVRDCAYVFICVKPLQVKDVLLEVKNDFKPGVCLISIAGSLKMENITKIFSGKIIRVIPSVTAQAGVGVSLICYGQKSSSQDKKYIEKILAKIGSIKVVLEDQLRLGADLTSCMPAFIAKIVRDIVEAAAKCGKFSVQEAQTMLIQTLYGTARLFCDCKVPLETMMTNVATKGGITAEGIKVLDKKLVSVLTRLFDTTATQDQKRSKIVDKQYE